MKKYLPYFTILTAPCLHVAIWANFDYSHFVEHWGIIFVQLLSSCSSWEFTINSLTDCSGSPLLALKPFFDSLNDVGLFARRRDLLRCAELLQLCDGQMPELTLLP